MPPATFQSFRRTKKSDPFYPPSTVKIPPVNPSKHPQNKTLKRPPKALQSTQTVSVVAPPTFQSILTKSPFTDKPRTPQTPKHQEPLESNCKSLQRASQRHSSTPNPSSSACGRPFPRAPRAPLRSAGAMRAFRLSPSLHPPPPAAAKRPNTQTLLRPADIARHPFTDPSPTVFRSRPLTVSAWPITRPSQGLSPRLSLSNKAQQVESRRGHRPSLNKSHNQVKDEVLLHSKDKSTSENICFH